MNVGNLCTRNVAIIHSTASVVEAAQRMREDHVGDLVVVREEPGAAVTPLGVVTDRDIVVMVVARGLELVHSLVVGDLVTRPLVVAHMNEESHVVARRMRENNVRRLPVLNERGGLVGIVTVDDLIGGITADLGEIAHLVCGQARQEGEVRP